MALAHQISISTAVARRSIAPAACCFALLGCLASSDAAAERSRLGEDGESVEAGDCQLEAGRERRSRRGAAGERESSVQLDCGIGWRTELALSLARKRNEAERERSAALEARTSVREPTQDRMGWALAYGAGAERAGSMGWRQSERFAVVEMVWHFGASGRVQAAVGHGRDLIARVDRTLWALEAQRAFGARFELQAGAEGDDRSRPLFAVALRAEIWPEHLALTLTRAARGGAERERRSKLALAVEF